MKTWFSIDGTLDPIEYIGESYFRFPEELARIVLERYSAAGDWILDPFCGFGTTIAVAQRLGRYAVGFEVETDRARFTASRTQAPSQLIHDDARRIGAYGLPSFDLLFTSPPYGTLRLEEDPSGEHYLDDLRAIFAGIKPTMKAGASLVVEMSNVRDGGRVSMLAWNAARALADLYRFEGEIVRCNTGAEPAGPGYDHSYLLVFRNA